MENMNINELGDSLPVDGNLFSDANATTLKRAFGFVSTPARKRSLPLREMEAGDYSIHEAWSDKFMMTYIPPGGTMPYTAPLTTDEALADKRRGAGTYWWWNGDEDKPTLHPSVEVPGWHGWLRDGNWIGC